MIAFMANRSSTGRQVSFILFNVSSAKCQLSNALPSIVIAVMNKNLHVVKNAFAFLCNFAHIRENVFFLAKIAFFKHIFTETTQKVQIGAFSQVLLNYKLVKQHKTQHYVTF